MTKILFCLLLINCFLIAANAQDFEETGLASEARIIRESNVRKLPSSKSAQLDVLPPAAEVRVLERNRQKGYLRVLYGAGKQGFVFADNIDLPQLLFRAGAMTTLALARPAEPCIATAFGTCPDRGCYDPDTDGALFNEAKRRTPVGAAPVTIGFPDMVLLQNEVGVRLGLRSQNKSLSASEREDLKNINVGNGTVGESSLVRIAGFIPSAGNGLKAGSIETVNCKFKEPLQKDIHIPLVPRTGATEYQGIVIEMIPQGRPAGWNLRKLKLVRDRKKKVLVVGGLFYDNEHAVNNDPARPLSGHSKRFSIWEIHPVTQFFVCSRISNSCSANRTAGWVPLENYQ